MNTELKLPSQVVSALDQLEAAGYEAWVVGGCVRDSLLGKQPHDWDIATNALPDQIQQCFSACRQNEVGIRHGTVGVLWEGQWLEITTYRIDREYADHRHPNQVDFTSCLTEDLARRDFTVNAMAYHPVRGLQDPFCGAQALKRHLLCCVGEPAKRFSEDALRIMRGIRFSSVLGFEIEEGTGREIHRQRQLLAGIAPERFSEELKKLLCGKDVCRVLRDYPHVLGVWIPEILPCVGMDQNSPHHNRTLWEHILCSVGEVPPDSSLRLAMLLHDLSKPLCRVQLPDQTAAYPNHGEQSAQMAQEILSRLKFDRKTIQEVTLLIRLHSLELDGTRLQIKQLLGGLGQEQLKRLLLVKRADALAQSTAIQKKRLAAIGLAEAQLEQLTASASCCTLNQLAINGKDLMGAGFPKGKQMGLLLQQLLQEVMEERCPNEKNQLLMRAGEIWKSGFDKKG